MKEYIEKRAIETGEYILETGDTVRSAAKVFGVSKSTVHKDLTDRLKKIDKGLFKKVSKVLETNKAERHIRGGNATHLKYKGKKKESNNRTEKNKSTAKRCVKVKSTRIADKELQKGGHKKQKS